MYKRLTNPYLLLILTTLFWAGNMVMGRGLREAIPPFALAFWRWAICLARTLPLALPHLQSQWPQLRRSWRPILLLGLLGVGCFNTFAYLALQHTTATSALLLNSFIPIATLALAWIVLGKRLAWAGCCGVLLSLGGVLTIVARGDFATLSALGINIGDLWMLAAVVVWAMYTVGLHWRPTGVDPMLLLAAMTVVGLAALTPAYLWEIAQGQHIVVSHASLAGIAYVGALPGFLGFVFYNRAVAEVGPGKASLFIHLMPVFGTLLSAIFLDERPQAYHAVGILLIFAGIYITSTRKTA